MNPLLKDLFNAFKIVEDVYARLKKIFIPEKAYSWQTLIYLSLFSWVMSYFATGYVEDVIAFLGWLFLIAGTAWYTTDDPLRIPGTDMPIGAVITGFLVSAFAFRHDDDVITSNTIVLWPTISAVITAIPEFIEGTGTESKTQLPKLEDRQRIIILIACSMVLSCWLQIYFIVNSWVNEYPSLQTSNFDRKALVLRMEPRTTTSKTGTEILNRLAPLVEQKLDQQPWSDVERWLTDANQQVSQLSRKVTEKYLDEYEEKSLWVVEPRITNLKSRNKLDAYKLDLFSIWTGPSSYRNGYHLKKSCRIEPIANTSTNQPEETVVVAEINCGPVSKLTPGQPPAQ